MRATGGSSFNSTRRSLCLLTGDNDVDDLLLPLLPVRDCRVGDLDARNDVDDLLLPLLPARDGRMGDMDALVDLRVLLGLPVAAIAERYCSFIRCSNSKFSLIISSSSSVYQILACCLAEYIEKCGTSFTCEVFANLTVAVCCSFSCS